jgi:hypothetical protein
VIKLDGGQIEYDRRIAGVSADMAVPT